MNSKRIFQILMVAGGLAIAIFAAISILLNPTGGISGLSKLITIIGIVIGIINPKAGIYFLVVQAIYCDEVKRIGVYYGVQSTQTVSEILIGPLLTICALNVSFLHGLLRGQYKIDFLGWVLYALAPLVAAIMAIKGRDQGLALSVYLAGSTSAYLTLIPIFYGIFKSFHEWIKILSFQCIVAAPAAAWGIWQYFNGFNSIEWEYALSGLSRVHSIQMTLGDDPRIFGLFGSASALGCVALFGVFSFWRACRLKDRRWIFFFLALLYAVVAIMSHQRSVLAYPFLILIFAYAFRRFSTTVLLYGSTLVIFIVGVLNATYLRNEGIEKINFMIAGEGRWAQNVLYVSTFSDRLMGWERLNRPETWSLFGTKEVLRGGEMQNTLIPDYASEDFNHDIINKILIHFGAVGLGFVFIVSSFILYQLHKVIFQSRDWQHRKDGAFSLACIVPVLFMSFMAGDNFSTTPINLQIWSIFAGIFVLKRSLAMSNSRPHPEVPSIAGQGYPALPASYQSR